MNKYFTMLFGAALLTLASCDDVPAPYELYSGDTTEEVTSIYYTSENLYTGWTGYAINGLENPWSQGSSYTQATSYQKWDGADTKTNKECEGYLISPKFNTVAEPGKVLTRLEAARLIDSELHPFESVDVDWRGNLVK